MTVPLWLWLAALPLLLAPVAVLADDDENETETVIFGPPPPSPPAVVARDEQGRVTLRATRIAEPIAVDGKLDDAVYARIPSVSGFIQQEPEEGAIATEKTEIWVFFDDRNIYVGARCWDSHPERMVMNEMRRDNFNISQNENVTLLIDTFYDPPQRLLFPGKPAGCASGSGRG